MGELDAEYIAKMEDVLALYEKPFDPRETGQYAAAEARRRSSQRHGVLVAWRHASPLISTSLGSARPSNRMRISRTLRFGLLAPLVAHPAFAQRVDTLWATVHGHRIHLLVSGTAGPTVVLEAGAGSTHRTWDRLRQQLNPSIRVVAYDRPGFGRSEMCSGTRDAVTIARELKAALVAAHVAPPYLLVGWSAGGIYMRVFASEFAAEVVGLILLDPTPEEFYQKAERAFPDVFRRLDAIDTTNIRSGPPAELAEESAWEDALAQARRSDAGLRAPVVLLSPLRPDLEVLADIWHTEQRSWTARQPNAVFRIVAQSGHAIQRDRPDTVARVIRDAIARLPKPRTP